MDALQSENIKKSGVERSLAALIEKDAVTLKTYGKTKLYLQCQAKIELPDEETAKAEEAELAELVKSVEEIDAELSELRSEEARLKSSMTLDEAKQAIAEVEASVEKKTAELSELGDPNELPTEEEKASVELSYYRARLAWKKRKKIVKNIVDTVSEAMNKKPKELMELIGLEDDEEAGVDLASFAEIPDPAKTNKRPMKRKRIS